MVARDVESQRDVVEPEDAVASQATDDTGERKRAKFH